MQGWRAEWDAISAAIAGVTEATKLVCGRVGDDNHDPDAIDFVAEQADALCSAILSMSQPGSPDTPAPILSAFIGFVDAKMKFLGEPGWVGLRRKAAALEALRIEMGLLLSDRETPRRLTERAFLHLQQSIACDEVLRKRWKAAFKLTHGKAEPRCETLGAVHLLSHGIWSFKAHGPGGAGGRTDLVLAGPLEASIAAKIEEIADALVLTEWKIAKTPADVESQTAKAIAQAKNYGNGVLAAVQLRSTRCAVIVTEHQARVRAPETAEGVEYRVVNVAVDPVSPSKAVA